MRQLGIDFGEKRIGLALSDPEGRVAVPLITLDRRNDRSAVRQIAEIAGREGIERVVLGEPRGGGGQPGEAAGRVHRFGDKLAALTGLPILYVDETLTSREAARRLSEAGGRAPRSALDAMAAQILLQEALDRDAGEGGH
jgi:putative Holliday junction resolvase